MTIVEEGERRDRVFGVTLKPTVEVDVNQIVNYAQGNTSEFPTDTIQVRLDLR